MFDNYQWFSITFQCNSFVNCFVLTAGYCGGYNHAERLQW